MPGGTHSDFTVELPNDQDCSRSTSVFLGSASFSNTFETITDGYNQNFYMMSTQPNPAPAITPYACFLYVIFQKDRVLPPITTNTTLYFMLASLAGVGSPYYFYSAQITPGEYTVDQLAVQLQTALRTHISTATVTYNNGFQFYFNESSSTALRWIPHPDDIATAVSRYNPVIVDDISATSTVNALLNMPRLQPEPAVPFDHSAQSGVPSFTMPTGYATLQLTITAAPPDLEEVRRRLELMLDALLGAQASVTVSGRQLIFDTGNDYMKIKLPTGDELTSSTWKAANWVGDYDITMPRSYNSLLPLVSNNLSRTVTTADLPGYVGYHVFSLSGGHYTSGSDLAAALQVQVRTVDNAATVAFDPNRGTLLFTSAAPWQLRFPTERELRDVSWRNANWRGVEYNVSDPQSFNGQLYFPSPSVFATNTLTSNIDLVPYREIYLSSSIANSKTLQSGSGAMDILARIPIDAPFGEIINFRAYGVNDALSVSDQHFRTVSFTLRDHRGRVLTSVDQPVVIELCFSSSDPTEM